MIVTIIADNYFGYCKKEVKTQISYAANLFGLAEEEHAGGALVFPSYDLGEEFDDDVRPATRYTLRRGARPRPRAVRGAAGGLRRSTASCPDIVYVPEDAHYSTARADGDLARDRTAQRVACRCARARPT